MSMPLHHAVLALLSTGPSYGYELKTRFEGLMGPQYGRLNIGHLYQVLDRLERDGLARSHTEEQPTRPDRVVHVITDDGRAEVLDWLRDSAPAVAGYRDDPYLKLMAATTLGEATLLEDTLRAIRADLVRELRDLGALRTAGHPEADTTLGRLLVRAAELQVRARIEWVDEARQEQGALLAGSTSSATPPAAAIDGDRAARAPAEHTG